MLLILFSDILQWSINNIMKSHVAYNLPIISVDVHVQTYNLLSELLNIRPTDGRDISLANLPSGGLYDNI